jgi:PAS domain S-box-containing protein
MINILLIDHALDEVNSVRRLLPALQASQFTIDSVIDYRAIFEALNRDDFDVCLIDSAFGNGLKLAGHIRSVGRTMPIILITSNNADEVLAAIRNGVADCLIRDQLTSGGVERSVCSVVDQDRAIALQALRESRYLALFDHSDAIIFTCDLYGKFTSMNRAGEKLMGFGPEEPLSRNLFDSVVAAHSRLVHNVIQQAVDTRRLITDEIILITKDGSSLPVEICAHPICQHGRAIEIQVTARILDPDRSRRPLIQASRTVGFELEDKVNLTKKNLAA